MERGTTDMSHGRTIKDGDGNNWTFIYNGDMSGDVQITTNKLDHPGSQDIIRVPADVLMLFSQERVASEVISTIEEKFL